MVVIFLDETPRSPMLMRKYRDKMMLNAERIFGNWHTIRLFLDGRLEYHETIDNALGSADICPEFLDKCLESAFHVVHYNTAYMNPVMTLEIAKKYIHKMPDTMSVMIFCGNSDELEVEKRIKEFSNIIWWDRIHSYCRLPESMIIEKWEEINFPELCSIHQLREEFIRKECFPRLIYKNNLKMSKRYRKMCIESICAHQRLSQQFMSEYADHIIWTIALACQKTDDEFFIKYKDRIKKAPKDYYKIYYSDIAQRLHDLGHLPRAVMKISSRISGLPPHLVRGYTYKSRQRRQDRLI